MGRKWRGPADSWINRDRRAVAFEKGIPMRTPKIWTACQSEYLPVGKGKVLDVCEGPNGEDRVTFVCGYCEKTHTNAQVVRG